ncbi:MAG: hypothetical protein MJA83_20535 [Gammaproteobacteria bacterium]|nr:hypothetical protein [Gammaproteobacteria bacterium]
MRKGTLLVMLLSAAALAACTDSSGDKDDSTVFDGKVRTLDKAQQVQDTADQRVKAMQDKINQATQDEDDSQDSSDNP